MKFLKLTLKIRLDLAKRSRLVTLYENHDLHFERGRFKILKTLAIHEGIICSQLGIRNLIRKYHETG